MQLSFRWYGPDDPISISHIRQIPDMRGIVTALSDIPIGDVWTAERLKDRSDLISQYSMHWNVVESLSVHEEIKWAGPRRDEFIANYRESLRNVGTVGIPIVCYNFMPICDWMRTKLTESFDDSSTGTSYYHTDAKNLSLTEVLEWNMPAWATFSKEDMLILQDKFSTVDEEQLARNLEYFLQAVIPVAEQARVKMAIHPDDPPWAVFGLPRVVKNRQNLQAIMDMVDSPYNGIAFCTGSLGANPDNDLVSMIQHFGSRIHFAHTRNVQCQNHKNFREVPHATKSEQAVNVAAIIRAYKNIGFTGPMRPDHGRVIWDEKNSIAGYGLYDRALGASYLQGLWDSLDL